MHFSPLMCLCALMATAPVLGQSMHAQPYDARLRSDPAVGNVQGVQRYGRSLRTDPDEGQGYSYHVYPVASDNSTGNLLASQLLAAQLAQGGSRFPDPHTSDGQASPFGGGDTAVAGTHSVNTPPANLQTAAMQQVMSQYAAQQVLVGGGNWAGGTPSTQTNAFDATRGLRNYSTAFSSPDFLLNPLAAQAALRATAFGVAYDGGAAELATLYHQPLIQIKIRVVEVVRTDAMQASSILEYVSRAGEASLTSGLPANGSMQNFRGISRFLPAADDLITSSTGSGVLFNLTAEHINWAVQLLATQFEGDVVTAPEVVTLNGQNVEFVSGSKVPFQLGQNVIQGTNNNIQQFFYKNVGTYVSVTPKIVNWGFHGEGSGERPIADSEIQDWNKLANLLLQRPYFPSLSQFPTEDDITALRTYAAPGIVVPVELQTKMLMELNRYRRSDLYGNPVQDELGKIVTPDALPGIHEILVPAAVEECSICKWTPNDCTIDLSLVVRLSEKGTDKLTIDGNAPDAVDVTTEENVRAIANVIQIQSGQGVVMAGLIGERDQESIRKVPVLGDLPYVGALFRDKTNTRQKTELLIFLEAEVLDQKPELARAQSAEDFRLSQPYLQHNLLDNPMECSFQRAGMGSYLPTAHKNEQAFWQRHRRQILKAATTANDLVR